MLPEWLLHPGTHVADGCISSGFVLRLNNVSNGRVRIVSAQALLGLSRFGRWRDNLDSAFKVLSRREEVIVADDCDAAESLLMFREERLEEGRVVDLRAVATP